MNCHEIESRLLDEGDPEVQAHLASCERCQRRVAFAPRLSGLLRQAEYEPALPAGLNERLAARLDRVEEQKVISLASRRRWARPLVGLATLAACLAVVFWLWARPAPSQLAVDMVEHHEACFAIANSPGREQHYQDWLQSHQDVTVPVPPHMGSDLAEVDRRNCPVGEGVHGPHLMYLYQGRDKVSLYVVPMRDLKGISAQPENPALAHYKGYNVLVWESGGWLYGLVSHEPEREMRQWVAPATALHLDPHQFQASLDDHPALHTRTLRTGSPGSHRGPLSVRPTAL